MRNTEMFWKVFRLVGSDNEGEALAAIKKVKAIITSNGVSWNQFCNGLEVVSVTPTMEEESDRMMHELLRNVAKARFPGASDELINETLKKVFGGT